MFIVRPHIFGKWGDAVRIVSWLRAVRLLNLQALRRRKARAALAAFACAAGVALVSAVFVTQHSVNVSVAQVSRALAGPTPLRIVGPNNRGGLEEGIVAKVRAVPGVQAAVPVVQTVAQAQGRRGKVLVLALGVDCSIESIVGKFGCTPGAIAAGRLGDPPVISPLLKSLLGPAATLRTDADVISLAKAQGVDPLARLNRGRVVVFPLPQAQREFVRAGRVDAIYVDATPGTSTAVLRDRLRAVLPAQAQVVGSSEPPAAVKDATLLIPLLGLIALMALGIAGLLMFNVVSLTLAERRRELAIAGALGSTDRLIVSGALVESVIIGVVGGVVGVVAGIPLAAPVIGTMSQQVAVFTGVHIHLVASGSTLWIGPVVGAITAGLAALPATRRATRIDVVQELHARTVADLPAPGRRIVTLVVLGALTVVGVAGALIGGRHYATSTWQPPVGVIGLLLAVTASLGATVVLTPLVVQALLPWARSRGGAVAVAVRQLSVQPRRAGIAAAAVAGPVAFASLLAASIPAINQETTRLFDKVADGRVFVSTQDFNNTAEVDSKTSSSVRQRLSRLPGVASVDAEVFITAPVDGNRTAITAMDNDPLAYHVIEGSATRAALLRGDVLVGPALARKDHVHPGSTVTVMGIHGPVSLRITGIWGDPNTVGGAMTMSMSRLVSLFGQQPPEALFVRPVVGVSADRLARTIQAAHLTPGLQVMTPQAFLASLSKSVRAMLQPFWTLQRASLIVALMGTLSTLLLVGVQRRQELGVLAAVGLSPRALARLTIADAALVGIIGGLLGIVAALPNLVAMLSDAVFVAGSAAPFRFDVVGSARFVALAVAVVAVGAAWPAWRTSRLQVVEALRAE